MSQHQEAQRVRLRRVPQRNQSSILDKGSYERGFGAGFVYKNIVVDLKDEGGGGAAATTGRYCFDNSDEENPAGGSVGFDGLPELVRLLNGAAGGVGYSGVPSRSGGSLAKSKHAGLTKISITLRIKRPPVIGDKFSSRHGQKGVMSILWPSEDMPFSETSGMSPDIIINPHAFPSRMTIGMLIESMAAKGGALHGKAVQDSTPFESYGGGREAGGQRGCGALWEGAHRQGLPPSGSEPLYSGRLRHMVSDKSQVRATGAVNQLTRQPVKGRKRGGGIRLGEMERDSLLSHGCAFLLQDRLVGCSDGSFADVCGRCGG
ncbi:hypothetical protein ScalyP_jg8423, partial [Parmales sp. scaly parma]